jgi:hydrogenase nickel incorporation protein HypA/HybF
MHELSLMTSTLEIIEGEARSQGFTRVTRVGLSIGRFAGVEPEALRFAFAACTQGTVAEGAELVLETPPALGRCLSCARETEIENWEAVCPHCRGDRWRILSGKQMRVQYLDVD